MPIADPFKIYRIYWCNRRKIRDMKTTGDFGVCERCTRLVNKLKMSLPEKQQLGYSIRV